MQLFPVFLKYSNDKNYFKIISETEFDELCIMGNKYMIVSKTASIYPDRIFIMDLLNNTFENTIKISELDFINQLTFCKEKMELLE